MVLGLVRRAVQFGGVGLCTRLLLVTPRLSMRRQGMIDSAEDSGGGGGGGRLVGHLGYVGHRFGARELLADNVEGLDPGRERGSGIGTGRVGIGA